MKGNVFQVVNNYTVKHSHGILEAKSINITKMGRNGHRVQLCYFCLRKALKHGLQEGGRM